MVECGDETYISNLLHLKEAMNFLCVHFCCFWLVGCFFSFLLLESMELMGEDNRVTA